MWGSTVDMVDATMTGSKGSDDIYSADSSYTCSNSCGAGYYGECSEATGLSASDPCYVNCGSCLGCSPGKSTNGFAGGGSSASCESCSIGRAATQLGTADCESCEAGKYATDNTTVYVIITGASQCVDCPSGSYNDVSESVYCIACEH